MKNLILYTLLVFTTLTSCSNDDLLKTNEDPNVATSIDPDYLFGYASYAWTGTRTGGDLFIPIGLANQSISTGGNQGWGYGEDRYDFSPYSIGNVWSGYFVSVGNNLKIAIDQAESANPVNNNAAAQCKLTLANAIYELTMIYGDIPFREAWNATDYPNPVFDPQEQILEDILDMIDEALNQIEETSILKISDNDPFYKGDMSKWVKYGNSLKFKILMTMVDKRPDLASTIGTLASNSSGFAALSDNFEIDYYNTTNAENPKFKIFKNYSGSINEWFFANTNVFSFMDERDDPRIPIYYDANVNDEFVSVDTATEAIKDTDNNFLSSPISLSNLWKADSPDLILSFQEMLLLKAEVYARGLGVGVNLQTANNFYKEGVKQSLIYYNISTTDAENYVNNTLPDISSMDSESAIYEIHVQQWIDFQDRTLEGFIQSRRSGSEGNEVPNLELPNGAPAGGLFRRYTYPTSELTANSNAPDGSDKLYNKLWFDL